MEFVFEERQSDSHFAHRIWRTQSDQAGSFLSRAVCHWEIVVMKHGGKTTLTVRGPETKATLADSPMDAEFIGIQFKLGTFMPHLPIGNLVDGTLTLPEAAYKSFWLHGSTWQVPDFENADTFINRLISNEMLVHDPVVEAALRGRLRDWSVRSVQRRFVQATGLTHKLVQQIERAGQAVELLEQGVSIPDTVYEAGYFDQSHLTNSLKRFIGQTPAQIIRLKKPP